MGKIAHNEYTVPIKGLSIGKHNYSFSVDSAFFKDFGESPISEASLELEAELIKEAALIKVTCDITGTVVVECDRCLEDLTLPVKTTAGLIVKFVRTEEEEEDDEVMIMEPTDTDLDLRQFFYDYVCLSLPLQRVHPKGGCNEQMIEKLKSLKAEDKKVKKEANSPFEKLKNLLN